MYNCWSQKWIPSTFYLAYLKVVMGVNWENVVVVTEIQKPPPSPRHEQQRCERGNGGRSNAKIASDNLRTHRRTSVSRFVHRHRHRMPRPLLLLLDLSRIRWRRRTSLWAAANVVIVDCTAIRSFSCHVDDWADEAWELIGPYAIPLWSSSTLFALCTYRNLF
jgi:hypothetical protein